jgi:hypothetical protein
MEGHLRGSPVKCLPKILLSICPLDHFKWHPSLDWKCTWQIFPFLKAKDLHPQISSSTCKLHGLVLFDSWGGLNWRHSSYLSTPQGDLDSPVASAVHPSYCYVPPLCHLSHSNAVCNWFTWPSLPPSTLTVDNCHLPLHASVQYEQRKMTWSDLWVGFATNPIPGDQENHPGCPLQPRPTVENGVQIIVLSCFPLQCSQSALQMILTWIKITFSCVTFPSLILDMTSWHTVINNASQINANQVSHISL